MVTQSRRETIFCMFMLLNRCFYWIFTYVAFITGTVTSIDVVNSGNVSPHLGLTFSLQPAVRPVCGGWAPPWVADTNRGKRNCIINTINTIFSGLLRTNLPTLIAHCGVSNFKRMCTLKEMNIDVACWNESVKKITFCINNVSLAVWSMHWM